MHVLLLEDDLDHLVDVKVETLFHPALRLLELLLQVHHLIINNLKPYRKKGQIVRITFNCTFAIDNGVTYKHSVQTVN